MRATLMRIAEATVKQRSWISLIGSCILLALGAALAFAVIIAGASVALAGHQMSDQVQNASPSAPLENSAVATELKRFVFP